MAGLCWPQASTVELGKIVGYVKAVRQMAGRVLYKDVVPYDAPSSLDALHGSALGMLELPITVHWGPKHVYDLADLDDAAFAYQQIVREGTQTDQETLLNSELLREVWPELILPERCQALWESRFPELATP